MPWRLPASADPPRKIQTAPSGISGSIDRPPDARDEHVLSQAAKVPRRLDPVLRLFADVPLRTPAPGGSFQTVNRQVRSERQNLRAYVAVVQPAELLGEVADSGGFALADADEIRGVLLQPVHPASRPALPTSGADLLPAARGHPPHPGSTSSRSRRNRGHGRPTRCRPERRRCFPGPVRERRPTGRPTQPSGVSRRGVESVREC